MSAIDALLAAAGVGGSRMGSVLASLVYQEGLEMSVADVHRDSGVSKATTARIVAELVESGLVLEDRHRRERYIAVNRRHPLFPTVCDLVWMGYGAQLGAARGHGRREFGSLFQLHDWELLKHVPAPLQGKAAAHSEMLPDDVYDGPEPLAARALVLRLEEALPRVQVVSGPREAYSEWRDERDRDLSRLTQHVGEGVKQAILVLRAQSSRDAPHARIGRGAWAHAVFSVNSDALLCRRTAEFLSRAVKTAHRYDSAVKRLESARDGLRRHRQDDDEPARILQKQFEEQAVTLEEEVQAALTDMQRYCNHGGEPDVTSVGRAGERLLILALRSAAIELSAVVSEMAADTSFQQWLADHASVLDDHPLVIGEAA